MVVSLVLTIVIVPILIPIMKRLKYGQSIRVEGPQNHRKKSGTPTMGGIVFVLATILTLFVFYLFYYDGSFDYQIDKYLLLLFPFVSFSFIGFLDDYLIVVKKNNHGLSAKTKLLMEIIIAAFFFNLYLRAGYDTSITLFHTRLNLKWFYGVVIFLMLIGSANAVNLTDGLDGLAGGLSGIAVATFTYIAFISEQYDLMIIGGALLGSILGFLIFNLYPARIFMGDTGSLSLGALIASMAILLKQEWLLILVGGVFVIETLSVILQVTYFKKTKGKRLFKMSPLHHHFELSGMSETRVVLMFYIVGFIFSFLSIMLFIN
jgi:phospho-N-acetylmuramoyl-pentapeptide-transferase